MAGAVHVLGVVLVPRPSSLVLVLVLGAQRSRIEDEDRAGREGAGGGKERSEHEGSSPLSWTSASTYPGRLGGRKGQKALVATFSNVENLAALAARESTQKFLLAPSSAS